MSKQQNLNPNYSHETEKRFWEYERTEQLTCYPFLYLVNKAESQEEQSKRELQFISCMLEETDSSTRTCLPNMSQKAKQWRSTQNKELLSVLDSDIEQINDCLENDLITSKSYAEIDKNLGKLNQNPAIFGPFIDLTRKGRRDLNLSPDDSLDETYSKITETMFTACKEYLDAAEKCANQAKQQKNDSEFIREACFEEMQLMKYCQASTLCRQQTRHCIISGMYDKSLNHLNEAGLFHHCQRTDPEILQCLGYIYGNTQNPE